MEAYFKAEYDKVATCRICFERKDFSALWLSSLAQGANVVLLRMSMKYTDENVFTMAAALESMSEDESFVLHLMGRRLTGKLRRTEFNKNAAIVLKPYIYLTPGKVVPLPPP